MYGNGSLAKQHHDFRSTADNFATILDDPGNRQRTSRPKDENRIPSYIEEEEKHNDFSIKVMSVQGTETNGTMNADGTEPGKRVSDGPGRNSRHRVREMVRHPKVAEDSRKSGEEFEGSGGMIEENVGELVARVYPPDYDYHHQEEEGFNAFVCPYPTYYTYFTVLIQVGATLLAQVIKHHQILENIIDSI